MKHFIFTFFLLTALYCKAQVTVTVKWAAYKPPAISDTIYYNIAEKLIWKDFKGNPEKGSDALAITSSGFGFNAGASYRDGKANISVTVYCYFSKQKSWVIKGRESDYALNHEQHHFDVTWIVANSFFQKLKAAKFTWNNYNQLLDKIYIDSMNELEKMQNKYDGETRNGRLTNEQASWNKKITEQLKTITTN
jgi:hypothetical protein